MSGSITRVARATDGSTLVVEFTIDGFVKPTGRPKTGPRS